MVVLHLQELLGAGVETTSAAIDWAMSELLSNPSVMAKLRDELNAVVGQEVDVVEVSDIPHLPYLRAVVKETFRYHYSSHTCPLMSVRIWEAIGSQEEPWSS